MSRTICVGIVLVTALLIADPAFAQEVTYEWQAEVPPGYGFGRFAGTGTRTLVGTVTYSTTPAESYSTAPSQAVYYDGLGTAHVVRFSFTVNGQTYDQGPSMFGGIIDVRNDENVGIGPVSDGISLTHTRYGSGSEFAYFLMNLRAIRGGLWSSVGIPPALPPLSAFDPNQYVSFSLVDTTGSSSAIAGLLRSLTRIVDTTPPVIVCPGDITVEGTSPEGATVDWAGPFASDDSGTPPTVTCSSESGSVFPLGQTLVTYAATDGAGNTATCSFLVEVVDTTKPKMLISVPGASQINADVYLISPADNTLADVTIQVLTEDACDPEPTSQITSVSSSIVSDETWGWVLTGPLSLQIRKANAVVYTIAVVCVDDSGNAEQKTIRLWVVASGPPRNPNQPAPKFRVRTTAATLGHRG